VPLCIASVQCSCTGDNQSIKSNVTISCTIVLNASYHKMLNKVILKSSKISVTTI